MILRRARASEWRSAPPPRNPGESVDAAFAELFRVADSVMYEAKREGGNQVRASLV